MRSIHWNWDIYIPISKCLYNEEVIEAVRSLRKFYTAALPRTLESCALDLMTFLFDEWMDGWKVIVVVVIMQGEVNLTKNKFKKNLNDETADIYYL